MRDLRVVRGSKKVCHLGPAPKATYRYPESVTYPLAEALFDRALRTADSLPAALAQAATELGPRASRLRVGAGIGNQMTRLRSGGATRSASLSLR